MIKNCIYQHAGEEKWPLAASGLCGYWSRIKCVWIQKAGVTVCQRLPVARMLCRVRRRSFGDGQRRCGRKSGGDRRRGGFLERRGRTRKKIRSTWQGKDAAWCNALQVFLLQNHNYKPGIFLHFFANNIKETEVIKDRVKCLHFYYHFIYQGSQESYQINGSTMERLAHFNHIFWRRKASIDLKKKVIFLKSMDMIAAFH